LADLKAFLLSKNMRTKIKLDAEYECKIFINGRGGITIMQPNPSHDDMVVFSTRNRVNEIIRALQELKKYATFEPEEEEEEDA
jgi:hypothetical protein